MPENHYIVLLNDALKGHILTLPARERERLREKFEFLENGFWDAGVRVKKLRGIARRVVFEARLSKGDRLLFTLGDHRGSTAVYVWGIVPHDDISAEARRIAPRNAPFLDFAPFDGEERQELSMDGVPREWRSQEDVEQKVPDDYGPQRWLVLDDAEWQRLLSSPDPDSFEAFLFLTREQEELLHAVPPVLLSGTAGSGKTTLSVYYLLRAASARRRLFLTYNPLLKRLAEKIYAGLMEKRPGPAPEEAPRFLVFRELLREITSTVEADFPVAREVGFVEFARIFADHRDHKSYDAELVWEEIRAIIKGSKPPLAPARLGQLAARYVARDASAAERAELREHLVGLQELAIARRAEAFISSRTGLRDFQGLLGALSAREPSAQDDCRCALEEIQRLVEKSAADFSSPLLSLDEYLALGKKRAPNFLYDRRAIYAIAVFYQDRLARSGGWDEIDLTKAALGLLDGSPGEFAQDLIVCDEVQDLTDVQVALIFRLAADPRSVVLTGDPRQIINPSGFRWEEVKNKLYARGIPVPAVHRLSLNFRCVGAIVRLSNALLDLKAGLVGVTDTDMREEWKFSGTPPLLLAGLSEQEVTARMDMRGAGQVVLTRTKEARDRLKQALRTELVFTIAEAKGLEFDTVFLWEFATDPAARAVWRTIRAGDPLDNARIPHVRQELALLYVAVTRARTTLIVYDGVEPSVIWDIDSIAPLVFRTADRERLAALWGTASTPAAWEAQGDYFLEREHYAAARECFRNAGAEGKLALAEGWLRFRAEDWIGAAPLFEQGGDQRHAAECLEKAEDWTRAQGLWEALGEKRRQDACGAHAREKEGAYAAAARAWEALGESERALGCWEKAGAFDKVGRALARAGDDERAAVFLEKAHLWLEAGMCLERTGRLEHAADLYFRGGDYREAAKLYRKTGSDEKLLRSYRKLDDQLAIGTFFEKKGDIRGAVEAYTQYASRSEDNRHRLEDSIPAAKTRITALKAAIRYSALGRPVEAGPLFIQAGEPAAARQELAKTGDSKALAQGYADMGRPLDAARALERQGDDSELTVTSIQAYLFQHLASVSDDKKAARSLYDEAHRMLKEGKIIPALARFRLLADVDNVQEIYMRMGRHEEALRYFLSSEKLQEARRYASLPGVTVSGEFVESFAQARWAEHYQAGVDDKELIEVTFTMLAASVRGMESDTARPLIERVFDQAFGSMIDERFLPPAALDMLVAHRVANVIMGAIAFNKRLGLPASDKLQGLIGRVTRGARDTGDPDLAACAAFAAGDMVEFERQASALTLTDANAVVLGESRTRYTEAVAHLMANDWIDQAEAACFRQKDYALAGRYAEQRGEMDTAVRWYTDANDHEAALRCARASDDERAAARAYEHLGRFDDAIAVWTRLGKPREVERLQKKKEKKHPRA